MQRRYSPAPGNAGRYQDITRADHHQYMNYHPQRCVESPRYQRNHVHHLTTPDVNNYNPAQPCCRLSVQPATQTTRQPTPQASVRRTQLRKVTPHAQYSPEVDHTAPGYSNNDQVNARECRCSYTGEDSHYPSPVTTNHENEQLLRIHTTNQRTKTLPRCPCTSVTPEQLKPRIHCECAYCQRAREYDHKDCGCYVCAIAHQHTHKYKCSCEQCQHFNKHSDNSDCPICKDEKLMEKIKIHQQYKQQCCCCCKCCQSQKSQDQNVTMEKSENLSTSDNGDHIKRKPMTQKEFHKQVYSVLSQLVGCQQSSKKPLIVDNWCNVIKHDAKGGWCNDNYAYSLLYPCAVQVPRSPLCDKKTTQSSNPDSHKEKNNRKDKPETGVKNKHKIGKKEVKSEKNEADEKGKESSALSERSTRSKQKKSEESNKNQTKKKRKHVTKAKKSKTEGKM